MACYFRVLWGRRWSLPASFLLCLCNAVSFPHGLGVSTLQQKGRLAQGSFASVDDVPSSEPLCAQLMNHGTYATVELSVGTPPQKINVVADTGSTAVVVLSCAYADAGHSNHEIDGVNHCFRGTNHSSTFNVETGSRAFPRTTVLSYGSGDIHAVVATDVVRIGAVRATMKGGLLLMVDRALNFDGPFEGILGLGIPQHAADGSRASSFGFLHAERLHAAPAGFLHSAGMSHFSICLNDGDSGVLRLETPHDPDALGSIGSRHWSLGFHGITVGDGESSRLAFCADGDMHEGQETPCGAIPDSGTTAIMAPKHHLTTLFEGICEQWPRCQDASKNSTTAPSSVFTDLLHDCSDWLEDSHGLDELPQLHFHLVGKEGRSRTIVLGGWAYVFETMEEEYHYVTQRLAGVIPHEVRTPTGRRQKVCTPAFSVLEMKTALHGDIWVLGTSFFYEFAVAYDLHSKPPSISFGGQPCGTCGAANLLSGSLARTAQRSYRAQHPRRVRGTWRTPGIDVTQPL